MKNYAPYKRIVLFFVSLVNILFMSCIFAYAWYNHYSMTMYIVQFYRKGHYLVIALYAVILMFFSYMYGGLKIGQLRNVEVILSQYLSLFLTNIVMYIVISLLAFRFVNPFVLLLSMAAEMVVTTIFNIVVIYFYNRVFQPWRILLIYGEHPAADLVYKVSARSDKYIIYDAVNIDGIYLR